MPHVWLVLVLHVTWHCDSIACADVLAHFTPEHMIKLPLHNYEDIVIPGTPPPPAPQTVPSTAMVVPAARLTYSAAPTLHLVSILCGCADTWMRFFTALEADRKVAVFQQMWELCSGAEQNLIVKDFRFFFFRPGANAAAQAAAAAAAHS